MVTIVEDPLGIINCLYAISHLLCLKMVQIFLLNGQTSERQHGSIMPLNGMNLLRLIWCYRCCYYNTFIWRLLDDL